MIQKKKRSNFNQFTEPQRITIAFIEDHIAVNVCDVQR